MSVARAQYIMIGGFLGAGKTTAVGRLAEHLTERGLRVGLITNDQSSGLVDTALLRGSGFAVEEITGGCFCCRFGTLAEAAEKLEADGRPDVILAEPVGSCTDLVATVSYPLRRMYGERYRIAPLSVLVDPERARRVLGLVGGRAFSDKVLYVFRKQLEEASLIVVNKADTLAAEDRAELVAALEARYPATPVMAVSAKTGEGTEAWFGALMEGEAIAAATMDVDYELYAEGEALLGWYNATVRLAMGKPGSDGTFDANQLLLDWAGSVQAELRSRNIEIAHCKATLDAGGSLAALSLVSTDGTPDLREALVDGVAGGELVLNLRAEGSPDELEAAALGGLDACRAALPGLTAHVEHQDFFRPSPPVPTHRDAVQS